MGEVTKIEFSTAGYRQLVKALRETRPAPEAAPAPEPDPYAADVAPPWQRTSAGSSVYPDGAELLAFLDDNRTLRWIGVDRIADVPDGWRPLLVGPPVKRS